MHPTNVVAAAAAQSAPFTLTCGTFGAQDGYTRGTFGSIVPDQLFLGLELQQCINDSSLFFLSFTAVVADLDSSWRAIDITGQFALGTGTAIFLRANRQIYIENTGGISRWQFAEDALGTMVTPRVYECILKK